MFFLQRDCTAHDQKKKLLLRSVTVLAYRGGLEYWVS